jgi:hypothetical protein
LFQDWTLFTGLLFTIAGVGVGVMMILSNTLDVDVVSVSSSLALGSESANLFLISLIFVFPVFAISVSPFVGAAIAKQSSQADQNVLKLTAAAVGVGTLIYYIVSTLLFTTTLDGVSLKIGGLLITAVMYALVAAAVGVGGSWAVRNQLPTDG